MTNEQMAELLLKRAERIDAMNAFGMTADYVRELAEEAAAMRAGAKALLSSPESAQPWTSRERRLREALDTVKTKWKAWPPLTESTAHAMHLGEIVVAVDAALAAIRAARGTK